MATSRLVISALLAGLAACVTPPQHDDQVDAARSRIAALGADPLTQQAAANDLQAAQSELHEAEAALQAHRPLEVVDHHAYLAQQHAAAGEARVEAARAREQIARAQEERNRILAAQRAREAERARSEAAHARSEAQTARNEARNARSETESAHAELAQTQQELADLKAKQTDRGTVVTLGDVLFDTGRASLKPGADLTLARLAAYLKEHPDTRILIEGHTDSRGTDAYNDELSQHRADAVASALVAKGVPPESVRAVGRGKGYPVASNDTEAGRQQNRRVEILFSDANGRFAQGESEPVRR